MISKKLSNKMSVDNQSTMPAAGLNQSAKYYSRSLTYGHAVLG
jgi:hypothetical protein